MSNTIDIRKEAQADVDAILFGEEVSKDDVAAVAYRVTHGLKGFCYIEEQDNGDIVRVAFGDIPNLILALKKASELWNK